MAPTLADIEKDWNSSDSSSVYQEISTVGFGKHRISAAISISREVLGREFQRFNKFGSHSVYKVSQLGDHETRLAFWVSYVDLAVDIPDIEDISLAEVPDEGGLRPLHESESLEYRKYLDTQAELFEKYRAKLLKQYAGKFVLFEDGVVLAYSSDFLELASSVRKKYKDRPIFIAQVTPHKAAPVSYGKPISIKSEKGKKKD